MLSDQFDAKTNSINLLIFSTNIYQTTSNCWTHLLWSGQAGLEVRACQPQWSPAGQLIQPEETFSRRRKGPGVETRGVKILSTGDRAQSSCQAEDLPPATRVIGYGRESLESIIMITIKLQWRWDWRHNMISKAATLGSGFGWKTHSENTGFRFHSIHQFTFLIQSESRKT